jgi:flagellar hook-associated protein 2
MSSVGSSTSIPTLTVGSNGQITASNLVNNLDTTAIINAIMTANAVPQQQLEARITSEQSALTDYQNLNQSLQTLATSATTDSSGNGLNLLTVASSNSSVSATADTTASATQFSLQVDQIAQAQVSVTAALENWPDSSGAITIVNSSGTATEVDAASNSIPDVVSAINSADLGVTASAVNVGTDSSGNTEYAIQLTSSETGSAGAFQIYAGTSADYSAGTATNLLTQTGADTVQAAQDAQITLWPGSAAAQTISSTSNTFTNLEQGISVTVSQPTTGTVTLTSSMDTSDIGSAASTLLSGINSIIGYITQQAAGSTTTSSSGSSTFTPGAFTGDLNLQSISQQLQQAVSTPVGPNSVSPSTYGITLEADGSVDFDQATFEAALASDPQGTVAALQQIAGSVSQIASQASDPVTGTITTSIQAQQSTITNNQQAVTNWTKVLAGEQTQLQTEYSNLESTLSQLQTEQTYLTQQIDSMDQTNSSN